MVDTFRRSKQPGDEGKRGKISCRKCETDFLFSKSTTVLVRGRSLWYLCHYWQLLGHHGLELGGGHGGSIICSLVKLCDQSVDGQLQL